MGYEDLKTPKNPNITILDPNPLNFKLYFQLRAELSTTQSPKMLGFCRGLRLQKAKKDILMEEYSSIENTRIISIEYFSKICIYTTPLIITNKKIKK